MTPKLVKEWMAKAFSDLEAARSLSAMEKNHFADAVCFHAQQAVEKYLKAALLAHQVDPSRTHDLDYLGNQLKSISSEFSNLLPLIEGLSAYAVEYRYPGESAEHSESLQVLRQSEIACEFLCQWLDPWLLKNRPNP